MSEHKKNKTVKAWVNRHINDSYVKQANKEGYRSRAAYKLREFAEHDHLFDNVSTVIDLGAAPGSWSQLAVEYIGEHAQVIAIDLLEMLPLKQVQFIHGDFTETDTLNKILTAINQNPVDLVISDLAPNLSGIKVVDQARSAYLIELVLEFARDYLRVGGNCLVKVFQGAQFDSLLNNARQIFTTVAIRKPQASRDMSSEIYLLCKNKIKK